MARSLTTRNRQAWRLAPLAAQTPASRISTISSSGTGSGFRRRIARVEPMTSKTSFVAGIRAPVVAGIGLIGRSAAGEVGVAALHAGPHALLGVAALQRGAD